MAQAQRKKKEEVKNSRKTFLIIGAGVLLAAAIAIGFSGGSDKRLPVSINLSLLKATC
jgi:hypothetical protein